MTARKKTLDVSGLNDIEKVAVAQAIVNLMNEICSPMNGKERKVVDDTFRKMFAETGSKTFDLRVGGEKVGTYQIKTTKGTPDETKVEFTVTDEATLAADGDQDFAEYLQTVWLPRNLAKAAEDFFYEVGAVLDGCDVSETFVPGQKEGVYMSNAITISEPRKAVAKLLGVDTRSVIGQLTGTVES